jgi:acetone carboxylase gamma subunit
MEYQYSLYWVNDDKELVFLGDHIYLCDAKQEIEQRCSVCESHTANNPKNYVIKRYEE